MTSKDELQKLVTTGYHKGLTVRQVCVWAKERGLRLVLGLRRGSVRPVDSLPGSSVTGEEIVEPAGREDPLATHVQVHTPSGVQYLGMEPISSGFTGNTCLTCSSSRMVRNGTCEVCLDCGESSGCS